MTSTFFASALPIATRQPDFGRAIRKARNELGLKQAEAASRSGVPVRTFAGYERGEIVPPHDRADAIAEALGIAPNGNEVASDAARPVIGLGGPLHEGPITVPDLSPEMAEALRQRSTEAVLFRIRTGDGRVIVEYRARGVQVGEPVDLVVESGEPVSPGGS